MLSSRPFLIIILAWLLAWGIALTKYPSQASRLLTRGRTLTAGQLKTAKVIGYMGLGFGGLLLIQMLLGIVR